MSGTAGGGPIMRRNPCGSHGRPPSGPPGTEGTVLICPCAAGRRGLPDGVQLGFMGVQHGGKVIGAGAVAAAGGCRRAALRWAPRAAAAAVRPWHGASSRPLPSPFQQVTRPGCAAGWHCRLPWPARCRPGKASVVLAWAGDRSPIRDVPPRAGTESPSDTLKPQERPFAGILERHPRSASDRGGCSLSASP